MRNEQTRQVQAEGHEVVSRHDGLRRSATLEASITEAVVHTFSTPVGVACLDYLRSITLNRVSPPGASDAELRELEGQRRLVAGLISRINHDERDRRRHTAREN